MIATAAAAPISILRRENCLIVSARLMNVATFPPREVPCSAPRNASPPRSCQAGGMRTSVGEFDHEARHLLDQLRAPRLRIGPLPEVAELMRVLLPVIDFGKSRPCVEAQPFVVRGNQG